jgi:DNA-binding Lrp family transcriptional regulator
MNPRLLTAPPRWTSEEDNRLRALAEDGRSAAVIAERLKRSPSVVYKRARKLGVALILSGSG